MRETCFNREGVLGYPEEMKQLPYCNWRREQRKDGPTKVPYRPGTAQRACVDDLRTFSTLEDALKAVSGYDGVGVKIHGRIGCIDIDDCILEDGSLTETARRVLEMLPGALAEISPSGTGLHLFFLIPEGYVFDADDYYINNRKVGMENYFPGSTNRFMTVTGNVYRNGTLAVTAEELMAFQNAFMKRPEPPTRVVQLPEGGTLLTDAEVMRKAAACPNGQKFMDLYLGEWEAWAPMDENGSTDRNWTQSEADLSFCSTLAFFCRGDKGQMDRIFRSSGLMREKWDARRGDSTYGDMTMTRAIAGCSAFYERGYHGDAAADFADDDAADTPAEAEHNDETAARTAAIDAYLTKEVDIDTALSPAYLSQAAWAYLNDMVRYTRLKEKVPKQIGVRNFEREVKKQIRNEFTEGTKTPVQLLSLRGVPTPGMLVPENWIVDDTGIRHMEMIFGELKPVLISTEPLFVSAKLVNVDDGTEKLEITFRRNGSYKSLIAPRADLLNKNSIIKYADDGLSVSSGTAGTLTKYIAEMEAINNRVIPIRRSIRRAGWIGNEFYPYCMKDRIVAQTDGNETERILAALKTGGSEEVWMASAAKMRRLPFARGMLAAGFASPLLEKLQHRVIYDHHWYGTRSGKTATLKFVMSCWGDPRVLVSKYFSTLVGMERWAGTLKHLPFALDELQTLNQKKISVNDVVYTMGNGSGKTRGRVGAGLQKVEEWRNTIISTGEQPMSADNSMDGVNTRLMEFYACPLSETGVGAPDDELGRELHQVSEQNYGFAGEKYIRWLVNHLDSLKADFERIRDSQESKNVQRDNVAVLALADYYSSMAVFGLSEEQAYQEAIALGTTLLKNLDDSVQQDSISMAWDFICGWVASNRSHFIGNGSLYEQSPYYGKIEKKTVCPIASVMNDALEEAGFSARKCIKGFGERGLIESYTDFEGKTRTQTGKRINGVLSRVYVLNLTVSTTVPEEETIFPLTGS